MTQRQHTVVAMILVLAGIYLIRIAAVEIQPHYEGSAALIAASQSFGSSFNSVLATTGSLVLGPTSTGMRLPFVILGALGLASMLVVLRRLVSYDIAIAGTCMLAGSMPWMLASRHAVDVMPLCGLMLFVMALLPWARRKAWRRLLVFIPVIFIYMRLDLALVMLLPTMTFYWLTRHKRQSIFDVKDKGAAMDVVYYLIALFAWAIPDLLGFEEHSYSLGLRFGHLPALLQQQVLFPAMLGASIVWLTLPSIRSSRSTVVVPTGIAAVAAIIVQSCVVVDSTPIGTIGSNFHLWSAMLNIASVFVVVGFLDHLRRGTSRRMVVGMYALLVSCVALSVVSPWGAITAMGTSASTTLVATAVVVILMIGAAWKSRQTVVNVASVKLFKPVVYGTSGFMLASCVLYAVTGKSIVPMLAVASGARELASVIKDENVETLTYVHIGDNVTDSVNTQLQWYTRKSVAMDSMAIQQGRYFPVFLSDSSADITTQMVNILARHTYLAVYSPNTNAATLQQRVQQFTSYWLVGMYGNYALLKRRPGR